MVLKFLKILVILSLVSYKQPELMLKGSVLKRSTRAQEAIAVKIVTMLLKNLKQSREILKIQNPIILQDFSTGSNS